MDYTIQITDEEKLALEYAVYDIEEWSLNCVKERARIAIDEIVKLTLEKCLETGTQMPGTKQEIVELAYAQGWIESAKTRTDSYVSYNIS